VNRCGKFVNEIPIRCNTIRSGASAIPTNRVPSRNRILQMAKYEATDYNEA